MIVTSITESGKQKVKVTFDEQLTLVLYKGELKSYGLREGAEVPDDLYERISREVLSKRATKYVMNLLVKRDYTRKGLEEKLLKAGYPASACERAISYVMSYGYVDDVSYARRYLESVSGRKSLSRMKMDLRMKGVSEEDLEQAVAEAERQDEGQLLNELAAKKAASLDLSQEKDRQKLYRFLLSKGFSYGAVKDAVGNVLSEFS